VSGAYGEIVGAMWRARGKDVGKDVLIYIFLLLSLCRCCCCFGVDVVLVGDRVYLHITLIVWGVYRRGGEVQ